MGDTKTIKGIVTVKFVSARSLFQYAHVVQHDLLCTWGSWLFSSPCN